MKRMVDTKLENLWQAMDRLVRLAKVLPETTVTLVEWHQERGYTIHVGAAMPKVVTAIMREQGRTVIQTTWRDLLNWRDAVERVATEKG